MNRNRLQGSKYAALLLLVFAAACGKKDTGSEGDKASPNATVSNEPVTLSIYFQATVTDEDFKLLFAEPVKKKYPNITLEAVKPSTGTKIDNLIAAGTVPDILNAPNSDILGFTRQDLLYDIAPLLKKNGIDLNRFDSAPIDAVKSDKGEIWGLPWAMVFNTLYYSKDIFDKFSVPYPKDGMTWDDAIVLGKQMTRKDKDTQYRGLDVVNSNLMSFPMALTYVNGITNKSNINNDQWKRVFETTKLIQTIPGNEPPKTEPGTSTVATYFTKDKNLAMVVAPNLFTYFSASDASVINWDIAQYPSYKELPNVSGKVDSHNLTISKTSKYKDQALRVLEVLTSDEVQLISARKTAKVSPLKNPEMQKQFGADLAYLKGKNVPAIFKSKVVAPPVYSPFENEAKKIGQQKYVEFLSGSIDLGNALRIADEEINKLLATK